VINRAYGFVPDKAPSAVPLFFWGSNPNVLIDTGDPLEGVEIPGDLSGHSLACERDDAGQVQFKNICREPLPELPVSCQASLGMP
jgi:hypothetical protein